MIEKELNLAHFFAWARPRALRELETRLQADPTLDPNWTFSDIMQELLEEYRRTQRLQPPPETSANQREGQ